MKRIIHTNTAIPGVRKLSEKVLAMFLAVLMIFGTAEAGLFGMVSLFETKAEAAEAPSAVIAVPETIYLEPNATSATKFQYYVNNQIADDNKTVTPLAEAAQKNGLIEMYCEGATYWSVQLSDVTSGSTFYSAYGKSISSKGSFSFGPDHGDLNMALSAGLEPGKSKAIKWTIKYTVSGTEHTVYAYSVVYAPYINIVGGAADADGDSNWHDTTYCQSAAWWQGVHGFSDYPMASKRGNGYDSEIVAAYPKISGDYKLDPMINGISGTSGTGGGGKGVKNWLSETSTGRSASIHYGYWYGTGTTDWCGSYVPGYTSKLTVDRSRYSNLNQIPNLKVGCLVTDTDNASTRSYYLSIYTDSYYYGGQADDDNKKKYADPTASEYMFSDKSSDTSKRIANANFDANKLVYNGAVSYTLPASGTANFAYKSFVQAYDNTYAFNVIYCPIEVACVSKTDLRAKVLEALALEANGAALDEDISKASFVLGDPTATQADVDKNTVLIGNEINALTKNDDRYPVSKFYAPEMIYLNPSDQKSFQYYVDSNTNGTLRTGAQTSGIFYFEGPAGSKVTNVTCDGATFTMGAKTSSNNILNTTITAGSVSSAVSTKNYKTLTWTVTYTMQINGKTYNFTAKAYTECYSPNRNVTACGVFGFDYNSSESCASSLIWVQGVHSTPAAQTGGDYCGTRFPNTVSGYLLDPLKGSVSNPSTSGTAPESWGSTLATYTDQESSFRYSRYAKDKKLDGNGDWVMTFDHNDSAAKLYVDTSRTTNLNQVPYFKIGFLVTDWQNSNSRRNWYISDATSAVSSGKLTATNGSDMLTNEMNQKYWKSDNNSKAFYNSAYGTILKHSGNKTSPEMGGQTYTSGENIDGNTDDEGLKYWSAPSTGISAGTTRRYYKCAVTGNKNSSWAMSSSIIMLDIIGFNKTNLRNAYLKEISSGRQQSWYTSDSWTAYENALKAVAQMLERVDADTSTSTSVISTLQTKANALVLKSTTVTSSYIDTYDNSTIITEFDYTTNYCEDITVYGSNIDGYTYAGCEVKLGSDDYVAYTLNSIVALDDTVSIRYKYNRISTTMTVDPNGGVYSELYFKDGAATFTEGNDTTNLKFSGSYQEDGAIKITGTSKNNAGELTYETNKLCAYLEEGQTYKISFVSNIKNTDFFIYKASTGMSCRSGRCSYYVAGTDGKYHYDITFIVGAAGGGTGRDTGEGTWHNTSYAGTLTSVYNFRFDVTGGYNGSYEVTDLVLQKTSSGTSATQLYKTTRNVRNAFRPGYIFNGWDILGGGSISGENSAYVFKFGATDATVKASWTPITYTVSFGGNGGTGSMDNQEFEYDTYQNLTANGFSRKYTISYKYGSNTANSTITAPTAESVDAYADFSGWATSASGSKAYDNQQNVGNLTRTNGATIALYAKWLGITVTLPTPSRPGYIFEGWYDAATGGNKVGNGGDTITLTGDRTIYAHWKAKSCTVQFNTGFTKVYSEENNDINGKTVTATFDSNMPTTYANGTAITFPVRRGYIFGGFYDGSGGTGTQYYTAAGASARAWNKDTTSPTSLYAKWTPINYTIAFDGNGKTGGSTAGMSMTYDTAKNLTANGFERKFTVTYNYGTSTDNSSVAGLTPTSETKTSDFVGWATTASGAKTYNNQQSVNNLTYTNNAAVTLYAKWTDKTVTLPNPTRTGYTFDGWYDAATGGNKIGNGGATITLNSTRTLYAHWTAKTYTVKFDCNFTKTYGGENNSAQGQTVTVTFDKDMPTKYDGGTAITFPVRPGYTFGGFYDGKDANGNGAGTQYYTASKTSARKWDKDVTGTTTLYAKWTPNNYTLTIDPNGGVYGGKTEKTVETVPFMTQKTIANPTRTGYIFTGWQAYEAEWANGAAANRSGGFTQTAGSGITNYKMTKATAPTGDEWHWLRFANGYDLLPGDKVTIEGDIYVREAQVGLSVYNGLRNNDYDSFTNNGATVNKAIPISSKNQWVHFSVTREILASDGIKNQEGYFEIYTGSVKGKSGTVYDFDLKNVKIKVNRPTPTAQTVFTMPGHSVTLKATWEAKKYTIPLNNNNPTTAGSTSVVATYDSPLPTDITLPEKTGYDFVGYEDADGNRYYTYNYSANKLESAVWKYDGVKELTAIWNRYPYTVHFHPNGATNASSVVESGKDYYTQLREYDDNKFLGPNNYTRKFTVSYYYGDETGEFEVTGKAEASQKSSTSKFDGWTTTSPDALKTQFANNTQENITNVKNSIIDLYAQWTDRAITLPTPVRVGHGFLGWYNTDNWSAIIEEENNFTDEEIKQRVWDYLISQGWNSDGAIKYSEWNIETQFPSGYEIPERIAKSRDHFVGFGGEEYTVSANVTLYARWEDNEAPKIEIISVTNDFAMKQTITVKLSDNEGIKTYQWCGGEDISLIGHCDDDKGREKTLTFEITAKGSYTLSVNDVNGNHSAVTEFVFHQTTFDPDFDNTGDAYSVITYKGNSLKLPAATKSGYTFCGWYTAFYNGTRASETEYYAPASTATLYGTWTPNLVLLDENHDEIAKNLFAPVKKTNACGGATFSFNDMTGECVINGTMTYNSSVLLSSPFRPESGKTYVITIEVFAGASAGDGRIVLELLSPTGEATPSCRRYFSVEYIGGIGKAQEEFVFSDSDADSIGSAVLKVKKNTSFVANNLKFKIKIEEKSANYAYSADAIQVFTPSAVYAKIPTPVRTGYTFEGWYDENNTKITSTYDFSTVTGSKVLKANWIVNKYYIEYRMNRTDADNYVSGSMQISEHIYSETKALNKNTYQSYRVVTFDKGCTDADVPNPGEMKAYAVFKGWSEIGFGSVQYVDEEKIGPNGTPHLTTENRAKSDPILLYAVWEDGTIELPTLVRQGYSLQGWFVRNADGTMRRVSSPYRPEGKNIELVARWTPVNIIDKKVAYDFASSTSFSLIDTKDTIPDTLKQAQISIGKSLKKPDELGLSTYETNINNTFDGCTYSAKMAKNGNSVYTFSDATVRAIIDESVVQLNAGNQNGTFEAYYEFGFMSESDSEMQYITGKVTFAPANNVYYEETAFRTGDSVYGDSENYGSEWTAEGTLSLASSGIEYQAYGYENEYSNKLDSSSLGTYKAVVSEAYPSSKMKEYRFTGTGFELYSECGPDTSALMVYVWKYNGTKFALVANTLVDTMLGDNVLTGGETLCQMPVYHFMTSEYGEYLVQVCAVYADKLIPADIDTVTGLHSAAKSLARVGVNVDEDLFKVEFVDKNSANKKLKSAQLGGKLAKGLFPAGSAQQLLLGGAATGSETGYIDGIRIYKPTELEGNYYSWEKNAQFVNVLQISRMAPEKLTEYNTDDINAINEVYLSPESAGDISATAFGVTDFASGAGYRVMISLRAVSGAAEVTVSGGDDSGKKMTIQLGHAVEMYYDVTDVIGESGIVIVSNSGTEFAAVCNVKLTTADEEAPEAKIIPLEPSLVRGVRGMLGRISAMQEVEYVPLSEPAPPVIDPSERPTDPIDPTDPTDPDDPVTPGEDEKKATVNIPGYDSQLTVDFRSKVIFHARTQGEIPQGAKLCWYVDGKRDNKADGKDKYELPEVKEKTTVTAKLIGTDGTELSESNSVTVNPKTGIFQWILAFLRYIFRCLPVIDKQ